MTPTTAIEILTTMFFSLTVAEQEEAYARMIAIRDQRRADERREPVTATTASAPRGTRPLKADDPRRPARPDQLTR